jgi:hypothetical protein
MCSTPRYFNARPTWVSRSLSTRTVRLRRMEVVAAAIGVEARRQAVHGEHFNKRPKRRCGAFFLDQECRIDRAGRIIHRDNQIELRPACKPRCPRAVLVQHHALPRLALALAAVGAAPLGALHQARRVQLRLHPGVAPPEAVVAHQALVEMLHVPAPVNLPIQLQHPPRIARRNPLRRRLAEPPVDQPLSPVLLVAPPIAPELPLRHPQQLARLHHR